MGLMTCRQQLDGHLKGRRLLTLCTSAAHFESSPRAEWAMGSACRSAPQLLLLCFCSSLLLHARAAGEEQHRSAQLKEACGSDDLQKILQDLVTVRRTCLKALASEGVRCPAQCWEILNKVPPLLSCCSKS